MLYNDSKRGETDTKAKTTKARTIVSTNESETKLKTMLSQYKQALKKQTPNIDLRRPLTMSQYANNYINEVDRLNGALHDKPLISELDRRKLTLRKNAIMSVEQMTYPIIGAAANYKLMCSNVIFNNI